MAGTFYRAKRKEDWEPWEASSEHAQVKICTEQLLRSSTWALFMHINTLFSSKTFTRQHEKLIHPQLCIP